MEGFTTDVRPYRNVGNEDLEQCVEDLYIKPVHLKYINYYYYYYMKKVVFNFPVTSFEKMMKYF